MQSLPPLAIRGVVQKYAWGGYDALADLLGVTKENPREPWAELWLGAHSKGPATLNVGTLDDFIAADSARVLGPTVAEEYEHRLPYLLKVLDVREMLSIQAHPDKATAEIGFAREEASGLPRTAPNRNFRDRNHKPELGVALTDFYLLHGFKLPAAIRQTLLDIPGWDVLLPVFDAQGVKGLYAEVMETSQVQINSCLASLAEQLAKAEPTDKGKADFWAKRAFQQYTRNGDYDRGIFSIYWFNLVHLRPGEGIFQAAGIPHAYLEGSCVELMANSDNVLRGGLTVKHIDVPELLKNLHFGVVEPEILSLTSHRHRGSDPWYYYRTPVNDFHLSRVELLENGQINENFGPAIYLIYKGKVRINDAQNSVISSGEAIFLPHLSTLEITALEDSLIFRATTKLEGGR